MLYINTILFVFLKLILIPRNLQIAFAQIWRGYKLVGADHLINVKQGGLCIYFKESLPVKVINLPYLKEALL